MEEGRGEACWEKEWNKLARMKYWSISYNIWNVRQWCEHHSEWIKGSDSLMWTGHRLASDPPSYTAPKLQNFQGLDCLDEHSPDNAPHRSSASCSHWWQTVGQRPPPKERNMKSQKWLKIYNHFLINMLHPYSSKLCRNESRSDWSD